MIGISDLISLHNIGWSIFLYGVFKIFYFVDYSILQKLCSITLSTIGGTISYFVLRKFFKNPYALLGMCIMLFEPHLVQNSTFGISEPLYLLLVNLGLAFSLGGKRLGSLFAGLAATVRLEGVFVLFLSILESRRRSLLFMPLAIIPIIALALWNIHFGTLENIFLIKIEHEMMVLQTWLNIERLGNSILYLGWSMFPFFITFVPIGILALLKEKKQLARLLLYGVVLCLPGLLAYLRAYDIRYFFSAYIIFCIISMYGVQMLYVKFGEQIKRAVSNSEVIMASSILASGIILGSSIILSR